MMKIFCNTKVINTLGIYSLFNIYQGKPFEYPCIKISFNDNTNLILPKGGGLKCASNQFIQWNENDKIPQKSPKLVTMIKEFEFQNECIDPYLIGITLFCKNKNNIFFSKKLAKFQNLDLKTTYYNVEIEKYINSYYKICPKEGYADILFLDLKKQKLISRLNSRFIPDNYLFSKKQMRLDLFQGILDIAKKEDQYIRTCSEFLAKDIATLIRSLGGFAKINKLNTPTNFYQIYFCLPFQQKRTANVKKIVSIEYAGSLPCIEIPVDSLIIENFLEIN